MDMRVAPAGLDQTVANRLLDLLSTDDVFRELFVKDTNAALELVGYVHADERLPSSVFCFLPRTGKLASKESIAAAREKLFSVVSSIHGFACPFEAQHSS